MQYSFSVLQFSFSALLGGNILDESGTEKIFIPYSSALRQLYLEKEQRKQPDFVAWGKILKNSFPSSRNGTAENPLTDRAYFLHDLLYIKIDKDVQELPDSLLDELFSENGKHIRIEGKDSNNQKITVIDGNYTVFERSASQTRQGELVLISTEYAAEMRKRISCGLHDEPKTLPSKYAAYRALTMTAGTCVDCGDFLKSSRILIVNDAKYKGLAKYVTANAGEHGEEELTFQRENEGKEEKETLFDGEGMICPAFARKIRRQLTGEGHTATSFQIRLPYVKGVVHEVDFVKVICELLGVEKRTGFISMTNLGRLSHPIRKTRRSV